MKILLIAGVLMASLQLWYSAPHVGMNASMNDPVQLRGFSDLQDTTRNSRDRTRDYPSSDTFLQRDTFRDQRDTVHHRNLDRQDSLMNQHPK